jgi:hypothetical protein
MTIIEIRPYRNGWKVFEAAVVEPVFLNQGDDDSEAHREATKRSHKNLGVLSYVGLSINW